MALLISDPRTKRTSKSKRKRRCTSSGEDVDYGGEKSDCGSEEEEEESESSDDGDSVEGEEEEDGDKGEEKNNAIQVSP